MSFVPFGTVQKYSADAVHKDPGKRRQDKGPSPHVQHFEIIPAGHVETGQIGDTTVVAAVTFPAAHGIFLGEQLMTPRRPSRA